MRTPRILVVTPHPGRRCTFRIRPALRGEYCEAIVPESPSAGEHRCKTRHGIEFVKGKYLCHIQKGKYLCSRHRRGK